jgi:hypothetical protein
MGDDDRATAARAACSSRGTCSELGRVASWVALDASGPRTLTISLRLADLELPSIVAERLPKALIHRNVPGERIHDLLAELDRQWAIAAPLAVYGASQRWIAAVEALRDSGWPVHDGRTRWRLGELTVDWAAVSRPASRRAVRAAAWSCSRNASSPAGRPASP